MLRAGSSVEWPGHLSEGLHIISVCQKCQWELFAVQNLTISDSISSEKSLRNQPRISQVFLAQKMLFSCVPGSLQVYTQTARINSHGKQVPDVFYDEPSFARGDHLTYCFDHHPRVLRMASYSEKMDPSNS
jgi:hypothetical protein